MLNFVTPGVLVFKVFNKDYSISQTNEIERKAKLFFYICTYHRITLVCEISLCSPPPKVLFSVHMQNPDARVFTALRHLESSLWIGFLVGRRRESGKNKEEKRKRRKERWGKSTPQPQSHSPSATSLSFSSFSTFPVPQRGAGWTIIGKTAKFRAFSWTKPHNIINNTQNSPQTCAWTSTFAVPERTNWKDKKHDYIDERNIRTSL